MKTEIVSPTTQPLRIEPITESKADPKVAETTKTQDTVSISNTAKMQITINADKIVVTTIVDASTKEVLRQIPPEEQLKVQKSISQYLEKIQKTNLNLQA